MFETMETLGTFFDLCSEYIQQTSGNNLMLNFLQLYLLMQGINFKFVKNRISVSDIPASIFNKLHAYIEPNKCYYNAEIACRMIKESKYIFGYWNLDSPVEHAWIKIGEDYFDPTYQIMEDKTYFNLMGYYPVAELDLSALLKLKTNTHQGEQPDLKTYFSSLGIKYEKIITQRLVPPQIGRPRYSGLVTGQNGAIAPYPAEA